MNCDDITPTMASLAERFGWRCRPVPDREDMVEVSTGRRLIDSEPVSILVRMDGDDVIVASDGGRSLLRLRDAGFDIEDEVLVSLWEEALSAHRVHELDDRVFVQSSLATAAEAMARLADAIVALDGLQILAAPKQARGERLAQEVESYLTTRSSMTVKRSPTIALRKGLTVQPSLGVSTKSRGDVLIQTGAASSKTQAFDHAFATFGLVDRYDTPYRLPQRLTILGGHARSWTAGRLRALSEVSFVGFWEHKSQILAFLEQTDLPNDPILAPPGMDVPMIFD